MIPAEIAQIVRLLEKQGFRVLSVTSQSPLRLVIEIPESTGR